MMAEVLDETLTTKVEIPSNGKRTIERLTGERFPGKQRRARRSPSQEEKEEARTQESSLPEHRSDAEQHPGNDSAAESGDGGPHPLGIELLINAMDKDLVADCRALSKTLVERARNGNESAMRLIIMLAERKKPKEIPVKKPRGRTLAHSIHRDFLWKVDEPGEKTAEACGAGELVGTEG